jgi:hypothetical protein
MNCQHCGAELTNKRAKNCPDCAAILKDANKAGTYGFVMEAIVQAKSDGLTGADMRQAMRSAMALGQTKRNEWMDNYRAWRKQLDTERKARKYEPEEEDARKDIEELRKMDAEKHTGRGDLEEEYGR